MFIAHIDKDMGMIEWRRRPDAHEFSGADLDHWDARIVVEVGNDVLRHGLVLAFGATIPGVAGDS